MLNSLQAMAQTPSPAPQTTQIQSTISNLQNVKSMMNAVKNSQNPQGMLSAMIAQNPVMRQAQEIIDACGGDGRKAFYQAAHKKGMTDQQIQQFLQALN